MIKIDKMTQLGTYYFKTVSGSEYIIEISDIGMCLFRKPCSIEKSLRKDNEIIRIIHFSPIIVGKSVKLVLEGLGEGTFTIRCTTKVVEIKEYKNIVS